MKFEVTLTKEGSFWLAYVPALDLITQGITKKEALSMARDAVETLVDDPNFYIQIEKRGASSSYVMQANDQELLVALLLRRQRQKYGLTLKEVAARLGSNSVNSFARYEQGRASPTLKKLSQLMTAIDPSLDPIILIQ